MACNECLFVGFMLILSLVGLFKAKSNAGVCRVLAYLDTNALVVETVWVARMGVFAVETFTSTIGFYSREGV